MNMQQPQNPYFLLNKIRPAGSKPVNVKALLTGTEETGKTSSVLYGAERPLLVFDLEDGAEIYKKIKTVEPFDVYPSSNPEEIAEVIKQMKMYIEQGGQMKYKSIFIDSGTDLYKKIISDEIEKLRYIQNKPDKRNLEPKEYGYPNSVFYGIIKNIKSMNVDFYISAHASDNYLKGDFMKINPNDPVKPDVHKDLAHEMDVHILFKKIGKNRKIKAEIKKSRLDDSNGNPLLPAAIENVDNKTIIKQIREFAHKDEGFVVERTEKPSIVTNEELSTAIDEIIEIVNSYLQLSAPEATAVIKRASGDRVSSPYQMNLDEAKKALDEFRQMKNARSSSENQ